VYIHTEFTHKCLELKFPKIGPQCVMLWSKVYKFWVTTFANFKKGPN